jgi:hypothetical protein
MDATLTYCPRARVVSVSVRGERLLLPTYHHPANSWTHQYEFRPGKFTPTDYSFELPDAGGSRQASGRRTHVDNAVLTIHERAARPPQVKAVHRPVHAHAGAAIFINDEDGGFFIHGWPPCNLRRCVVITQGWDSLLDALRGVDRLLFRLEGQR